VRADLRAVLEAPALVSGLQDVAVVGQAVEQVGDHFRINENRRPFLEGQVRCDDHRGSFVEPACLGSGFPTTVLSARTYMPSGCAASPLLSIS
jgi:hypothetical protein